jgi:hypothetical protein
MAKSKITGIELPEKASALSENYVKCDGKGLPPVPGTDADGIKGECPGCTSMIELRESTDADGNTFAVMVAHLAGGKTPPVAAGIKGVRTAHPSRGYGEKVSFKGNTPSDVSDVAPIVMGADISAEIPRAKMHKGREVPTNGTNAGGLGRAHIVMNAMTDLVGKKVPGMHGENDPRITRAEWEQLSRKHRQRYTKKIESMRRAAAEASRKRREFNAAHDITPVVGDGPTSVRPFASVPVGTRTGTAWDPRKGGTFVDTVSSRKGERSPLEGMRMDAKPSGLKYKSEPIFGRTAGR